MGRTSYNKQEWAKLGFDNFIVPEEITAPYTTIQNRAKVKVPSIKAVMGKERIHFSSLNLLNEYGPSSEQVFEVESKDSRIRFVGNWYIADGGNGTYVENLGSTGFMEVSFFGTGINFLRAYSAARDVRYSVDGGAENASTIWPTGQNLILHPANYRSNMVIPVVKGLSLGWHTVKIRNNSGLGIGISGIEILSETSQITMTQGQAFAGMAKQAIFEQVQSNYNAGVVGTKGARVVKYLLNGEISQAVTEVSSTPSYLTNTNHDNEDCVKKNWREFGANRADDFSTLSSSSDRAFTINDGTLSLIGKSVLLAALPIDCVQINSGGFITVSFVGVGLDLTLVNDVSKDPHSIWIDGVNVGLISTYAPNNSTVTRVKICSGLPYGYHTIKINRDAASVGSIYLIDFFIYQPKKPLIPEGAVQIADYNVMANAVINSSDFINELIPHVGMIAKSSSREMLYAGSGWGIGRTSVNYMSGCQVYASVAGDSVSFNFWGDKISRRGYKTLSTVEEVYIDGLLLTTANFPSVTVIVGPNLTLNMTTGRFTASVDSPNGFVITGLTLGEHTIKIVRISGADSNYLSCFMYGCPIHINEPSLNTGSLSLIGNKNMQPIAKDIDNIGSFGDIWLVCDANGLIRKSKGIAGVVKISTGQYRVFFERNFKDKEYVMKATSFYESRMIGGGEGGDLKTPSFIMIHIVEHAGGHTDAPFCAEFSGELVDE